MSEYQTDQAFAEWPQRALGWLIDGAIGLGVSAALLVVGTALGAFHTVSKLMPLVGLGWGVWLAVQLGQSGATPGMRRIGLKAVGSRTGEAVGTGSGLVRWLVHTALVFFWIPGIIDYLFPLWDAQKQTLADKAVGTVVTVVPKQPFSIFPPSTPTQRM